MQIYVSKTFCLISLCCSSKVIIISIVIIMAKCISKMIQAIYQHHYGHSLGNVDWNIQETYVHVVYLSINLREQKVEINAVLNQINILQTNK